MSEPCSNEPSTGGIADERVLGFIDLVPGAVAVLDSAGAILHANGPYLALIDRAPGEARSLIDGLHPADAGRAQGALERARKRGEASVELRVRGQAGVERTCEFRLQAEAAAKNLIVVATDLTAERDVQRNLLEQTWTDPLTGLANRAGLSDALEAAHGPGRWGRIVAFADLDRFKRVNDTLGHQGGDDLLQAIAGRLRHRLPYATIGRLGGDEFVAIVPSGVGMDPKAVGEEIRAVFDSPIALGPREIQVRASVGVVMATGDEATEELLQRADIAAYEAKRRGRNNVVVADQSLLDSIRGAVRLENDLESAMLNDEFLPWFQPVVEVETREPTGFESLMRWQRPDGEVLPASAFVEVASEAGLLPDISTAVRRKTISVAASTSTTLFGVNISPEELLDGKTPQHLANLCRDAGVDSDRIVVEVTEQTLISDLDSGANALEGLIDDGFRVALDDFGTGHSSLTYLTRLPLTTVKLGGEFIVGARAGGRALNTLNSIYELLTKLGHEVVFEGVETEDDGAIIRSIGGIYAQGWFYGRPGPIAQWVPEAHMNSLG